MSLNDLPGEDRGLGLDTMTYITIVRHALQERPSEMCGLLYRNPVDRTYGGRRWRFAGAPNVSEKPTDSFTLDAAVHRQLKERFQIGGIVHSHPTGEARPSQFDRETWVENGWWYLVIGLMTGQPRIGCWRIVDGRFVKSHLTVI